uniref:J domain-containing protein n=1 Tax=Picea sitchensis TaxID=3332 RepID=A9NKA6_PICSI|nr:unknown [Picea sitchensis]
MARFSVLPSARSELCGRLGLESQLRVRDGKDLNRGKALLLRARYSVMPNARSELCGRLALEPQFRVCGGKDLSRSLALHLMFQLRIPRSVRIIGNSGRCVAQAAACEQAEDKHFVTNGGLQNCTLYDFLGLPRDASQKHIKDAYRRSAKIWHPDIAMKGELAKNTEEFLKIHDAYIILSDPETRAKYDERLRLQSLQGRRLNNRFPGISSFDRRSNGNCHTEYGFATSWRNWETDQCW